MCFNNWKKNKKITKSITKKCAFNNLKKITHYYNNGLEEDIYFAKSVTLQYDGSSKTGTAAFQLMRRNISFNLMTILLGIVL